MFAVSCHCPGVCGLHKGACENAADHAHESEFMVHGQPSGWKYKTGVCDKCWKAWEAIQAKKSK